MTRSIGRGFVNCCALLLVSLLALPLQAGDDVYLRCYVRDLPITVGELPADNMTSGSAWTKNPWNGCRIVLEGSAEAYLTPAISMRDSCLYVRTKTKQPVKGRLICIPEAFDSKPSVVSFDMPAVEEEALKHRTGFFQAKMDHYEHIWRRELSGSVWFRHRLDVARQEAERIGPAPAALQPNMNRGNFRNDSDRMFDMMSGGRAISENLQLRRAMFSRESSDNQLVALDTVAGITTKEVDWSKLIRGLDPKIDSLAALIPADQHAVFVPSFTELLRIADEAEAGVTPLVYTIEPRAEDASTIDRYQTQLCLSRSGLSRVLGPKYIRSVALTGSDLNYRTGTDVAILFEAHDVNELFALLKTKIKLATMLRRDLTRFEGRIDGLDYEGFFSPDREISSYLMKLGNAVIVSNSRVQLSQLVQAHLKRVPSLAALPELRYFRERYKLGDADEHALVILSDATIRRWCGPKWRIGSARQLRELATMMELTSQRLDELVQRKPAAKPLDPEVFQTKVDDYRLLPNGIESPSVGSLRFLTPIAELPLSTATRKEVADYSQWRNEYQQNWTRGFDPIAIRLTLTPERIATDVTVLPLIDNTSYREMINVASGSSLQAAAGDPHVAALLHGVLSINNEKRDPSRSLGYSLVHYLIDEKYLGNSLAFYVDDDPLWAELAKVPHDELKKQFDKKCPNLPLAIRIGVGINDTEEAANGNIDQSGKFEQLAKNFLGYNKRAIRTHRAVRYVAVSYDGETPLHPLPPSFYVTVCGDAVTIAFKEDTIKKAIDRTLVEKNADDASKKSAASLPANLGQHAQLHLDARAVDLLDVLSSTPRQREMQNLAWGNIPILNEWRRLYPDQDPVELHARLWKTRLVCPGGGKYVWNDDWHTMESTLFGHPAQPKAGPLPSLSALGIRAADFGLTFVDGGLRARAEITRQPAK